MPKSKAQFSRDIILVTGGSGLIGQAVASHFARKFQGVALDVKKPRRSIRNFDFVEMDVSSTNSVRAALHKIRQRYGNRIASVIHLAAYYSFSGEHSAKYDEITVRGTERLIDELQTFEVEQFIFSSTMLVHAPCEVGQRIRESSALDPKWPYPKSKIDAENVIKTRLKNTPYVLMRIAGVYDDRCHSIPIAHQIERVYEHHLTGHFYPADPKRGQPFVHLEDLVQAFSRAVIKRRELPHELALLIGEPETLSYGDLQERLGFLIHGEQWKTLQILKPVAKVGAWIQDQIPIGEEPFIKPFMVDLASDHYALNISRAKELLGWAPQHRLKETLPQMIETLKMDPESWYQENHLSKPIPVAVKLRKRIPWIVSALGVAVFGFLAWQKRKAKLKAVRRDQFGRAA